MTTTQRICALVFLLSLTAGCNTSGFANRNQNCDPDTRLEELLKAQDKCASGKCDRTTHILTDCDRVRNEIGRLALDFPAHAPTLMANAVLAYEAGEPMTAQRYLDSIFALNESNPDAAVLRSQIAIMDGNFPFAQRLLERQISYTPDHAGVHEALSSLHFMKRDFTSARAEIDIAERLGAPSWRVAFNRGLLAEESGDNAEAQRHYQSALDARPEFGEARSRLAGAKAGVGYNAPANSAGKAGGG